MQAHETITVRRARAADASALRAILHDTFESTWALQVTPAAAQAFRDEDRPADYVGRRGLQFRVAQRGGEVAGFVDWDGDFVNALHVMGAFARQGVGAALMSVAEAAIAEAGFAAVRLETDTFNARSQAFYRARGYGEAGRYPDVEWDSGLVTLLLVKLLPIGGAVGEAD